MKHIETLEAESIHILHEPISHCRRRAQHQCEPLATTPRAIEVEYVPVALAAKAVRR